MKNKSKKREERSKKVVSSEVSTILPRYSPLFGESFPQAVQNPVPDAMKNIFDHWNEQGVIKHRRLTDVQKGKINSTLEYYSEEEIKDAISNYAGIVKSDDHVLTYKWTIDQFLSRHNGFVKFLTESGPWENYRRREFRDNRPLRGTKKTLAEIDRLFDAIRSSQMPQNQQKLLARG